MNDFAPSGSICQQVSLVRHRNEGRAIKNRYAPQSEGLATSLQIGAARRLRSAQLDPEVGHFARENGVSDDCDKAHLSGSIWMPVEVLSRSGLSERELLWGQIARSNGKVARIHARARCHATAE